MIPQGFKKPYHDLTLLDFQDRFPDEQSCLEYLIRMRWPNGWKCPNGCTGKIDRVKKRAGFVFECRACGAQGYPAAGTIFNKSRLSLRKWFWAIFLMATARQGVSALYLQKQLGIGSYRAAWLMGQKIRHAMLERDALYT